MHSFEPDVGPTVSVYRMVLACVFVFALLAGAFLSPKIVLVGDYPVSGSIFLFPMTYVILALFAEVYGSPAAWRLVWIGVGLLAATYIVLELVVALPAAPGFRHAGQEFHELYNEPLPAFLVIALAFLAAQATALGVYRLFRVFQGGRLLWVRILLIPLTAQVCVILYAFPLLYTSGYHGERLLAFMAGRILIAVIYTSFFAPFIYLGSVYIRLKEEPTPLPEPFARERP